MSDFDKEAEREKLREKYERDKEKRRETQRMSELLLKGATMTNRHCEECGDPIFRYDGQEFCPTCQAAQQSTGASADGIEGEVEQNLEDGVEIDVDDTAQEAAGAPEESTSDDGTATVESAAASPATSEDTVPAETGASTAEDSAGNRSQTGAPQPRSETERSNDLEAGTTEPTNRARSAVGEVGRGGTGAVESGQESDGDLNAARASLTRSIEHNARAAEQVDDPRRARDYLAAAREAAEALRALDR